MLFADRRLFAAVAWTALVATVATPRLLLTLSIALLAVLAAWTAITTAVTLALRLRIAFVAWALRLLTAPVRCRAGARRRCRACWLRAA